MKKKKTGFNTKLVHLGELENSKGSITVPIFQTSTFSFKSAQHGADCFSGKEDGYIYTRLGNPTINALEETIAELENGFGGELQPVQGWVPLTQFIWLYSDKVRIL